MEALCYLPFQKPNLALVQVPRPSNEDVLVKVSHVGLCGTDLHIIAVR